MEVNTPGGTGTFLNNCFLGLHGPVEVLSRVALETFRGVDSTCSDDGREDVWLKECLLVAGVLQSDQMDVLAERDCNRDGRVQSPDWHSCTGPEAAFHPFKTAPEYEACLDKAR